MCKNLFPEVVERGSGRSKMILLNTPGIVSIATLSAVPRGTFEFNGRLFVVTGTQLVEIILQAPASFRGPIYTPATVTVNVLSGITLIANDGLPASMCANQNQLLIASGGSVYIYYLRAMNDSVTGLPVAAGTFIQVPGSNFTTSAGAQPVRQVAFCDSFFLALIANSQSVQISNVLDGFNWIPGGSLVGTPPVYIGGVSTQIVVSVFPENVVGMIVDHRTLWLRGSKKSVAYYAAPTQNLFEVQAGSFVEQGGSAAFAASQIDNSTVWIHQSERGDRMAWRLNGYTPTRISTHAIEHAWRKYPKATDAVSYAYEDGGHSFWVVLFPSANNGNGATWVYDAATGLWHERDYLNVTSGQSMGHPSWCHAFWQGIHIVGDWRSANLYQMSVDFFTNAGVPIQRLRRAPHISTELETIRHTRFELDIQTGLAIYGAPPIILQAANGSQWQLTINDLGITQTIPGSGTPQTIKLTDSGNTTTWQLGVTNAGILTTTSITFDTTQPKALVLFSTTLISAWNLAVSNLGILRTSPTTASVPVSVVAPQVFLRWSDDGARTWSNYNARTTNPAGVFKPRIQWLRLGRARIRTYEVTCSDPIPIKIVDAYVNGAPGYQPSKRLPKQFAEVA